MKDWKQQQIYFMSVKHFWYLQNSDDSGKQSLYADGNADRNQNLIFCSLSYCEPAALKISCKSVWTFLRKVDNRETDKQAGGFLRPDCAPSSECSQFGMPRASIAARRRAAGSIRICRQASCCSSSATAGIAIGANFKIYDLRQFCSNRVQIFLQYTEDKTQKMMDQNFEIRIL